MSYTESNAPPCTVVQRHYTSSTIYAYSIFVTMTETSSSEFAGGFWASFTSPSAISLSDRSTPPLKMFLMICECVTKSQSPSQPTTSNHGPFPDNRTAGPSWPTP
eukprot:m.173217 g.173217  ORF g.173217 m.173217 type:complete len:105 (-) comp14843_c0_seq32:3149-3463(-)